MPVDFHCHVLPDLDHGSKNVNESVQMLENLYEDGIETVIASSHFYSSKISVNDFLEKRKQSYDKLVEEVDKRQIPKIILAAEVEYNSEIPALKDLEKLCIENTDFIMIEMPYHKWDENILNGVFDIILKRKLKPIIVHIERYIGSNKDFKYIDKLMTLNVISQINVSSLCRFNTRRTVKNLFIKGYVNLLGSDNHSPSDKCFFEKAHKIIIRGFGQKELDNIFKCEKDVLDNKLIEF